MEDNVGVTWSYSNKCPTSQHCRHLQHFYEAATNSAAAEISNVAVQWSALGQYDSSQTRVTVQSPQSSSVSMSEEAGGGKG